MSQMHVYIKDISQFGDILAHATAAELSWHVQNCEAIESPEAKLGQ